MNPSPKAIAEAIGHLCAILTQALPSDDAIIISHVRDALELLEGK